MAWSWALSDNKAASSLEAESEPSMPACAHCKSIIEESAAYCPYCGMRVEGVAECDD